MAYLPFLQQLAKTLQKVGRLVLLPLNSTTEFWCVFGTFSGGSG
ncbi:hypothetical protein QUB29_19500 [Microcoleus sp. B4b_D2]